MPRAKKGASKAKKNNKRKAPEPATATTDGAGPSDPAVDAQAATSPRPAGEEAQEQAGEENSLETRRRTALAMLLQLGLPEERALRALEATADEHSSEAEAWADEAGIWLAVDNECADESYAMGAAMHVSLVEAEERKATEKPLVEQSGKEIVEKFINSELLEALRRAFGSENRELGAPATAVNPAKRAPAAEVAKKAEGKVDDAVSVFLDDISSESNNNGLKKVLVDYLLMEQRCKKWYACSKGYFARSSEGLQTRIEEIKKLKTEKNDGGGDNGLKEPLVREEGGNALNNTNGGAGEEGGNTTGAATTTATPIDISEYLLISLTAELAVLEEAVYARPESDSVGPPAIFTGYGNVQEEVDLVDV